MSRHKTGYVISYHGILCHDMSYVTTIAASLLYGITNHNELQRYRVNKNDKDNKIKQKYNKQNKEKGQKINYYTFLLH